MCVPPGDGMLCNCTGVLTRLDLVVPRCQNSHPASESGLGKAFTCSLCCRLQIISVGTSDDVISGLLALCPSPNEILDCPSPALFVRVGLKNPLLRWLKFHYKGQNCVSKLLICVVA